MAFEHNGKKYWTVCSKNSSRNSFSTWAADIIKPKMTELFINELITNNIHVCGECMSLCDQHHGTRVLQECIAITMVASGHDVVKIDDNIVISGCEINFIEHKNQRDTLEFCMKHNLSCDSIFRVSGNVEKFMKMLSDDRDHMTLTKLNELFNSTSDEIILDVTNGSVSHKDILGDCLEGLILKINYSDGKPVKTVKYKFPGYTIRTMFLRDKAMKFISVWYTSTFYSVYYNDWVKRWVVMDKDYWNFIGSLIVKNYEELKKEYNLLFPHPLPHPEHPEYTTADCRVGFHIWLMEKITDMKDFVFNPMLDYKKMQTNYKICNDKQGKKLIDAIPTFNVIILMGSIGSGKSSFGNFIENLDTDKFKHIDGDILDLTEEQVLKLGKDRSQRTMELIKKALFENKIPIISTGGGVLLGSRRKLYLTKYLTDQFKSEKNISNIELKFTVLISANTDTVTFINKELFFYDDDETYKNSIVEQIQHSYNNYENFNSAIESRKARGSEIWIKVKNPRGIFDSSRKNFAIAMGIVEELEENCNLNEFILFPIINPVNKERVLSHPVVSSSIDYFKSMYNIDIRADSYATGKIMSMTMGFDGAESTRKLLYKSLSFDDSSKLLKLFSSKIENKTGKSIRELFPDTKLHLLNDTLHCTLEWVGGKIFTGIESTKKRTVLIDGFVFDELGLALIINRSNIENQIVPDGFETKSIDTDYHITIVYPNPAKNKLYGPKYSNQIISNIKKRISGIKILLDEPIAIEGTDKFVFSD